MSDQMDHDSAVVLLRAAHHADPGFFPAHYSYLSILGWHERRYHELRQTYVPPGSDPDRRCLAAVARHPAGWETGAVEPLLSLERDGGPTACTSLFLSEFLGRMTPRRAWKAQQVRAQRDATRLAPEIGRGWVLLARSMMADDQLSEARSAIEEGLRHVPDSRSRTYLYFELVRLLLQEGDTASSEATRRALRHAIWRHGASGLESLAREFPSPGVAEGPDDPDAFVEWRAAAARGPSAWRYQWAARKGRVVILVSDGKPAPALPILDRVIEAARQARSTSFLGESLTWRGRAYLQLGRLERAGDDLARAVELLREADDPYRLTDALHHLAHVQEQRGRFAAALSTLSRATEMARRRVPHSSVPLITLHDAGLIQTKIGHEAAAQEAFGELVEVVEGQQRYFYWAGEAMERMGDPRGASRFYALGLQNDPSERSQNLAALVRTTRRMGLTDSALVLARKHDEQITHPGGTPFLPEVLLESGQTRLALERAREWLAVREAEGHTGSIATAHLFLSRLLSRVGQLGAASEHAEEALAIADEYHLRRQEIEAELLLGQTRLEAGDPNGGLRALERAVALADGNAPLVQLRTRAALAHALGTTGAVAEALALYDLAATDVQGTAQSYVDPMERGRFHEQHIAVFDSVFALTRQHPGHLSAIELLRWSIRRKAAALPSSMIVPSSATDSVSERLNSDEALIDFSILNDATLAIVSTREETRAIWLPIAHDEIATLSRRITQPFRRVVGGQIDLARLDFDLEAAAELYGRLINPVSPLLDRRQELIISADGPLSTLPLEVLVSTEADDENDRRFVIDEYSIRYLPNPALLTRVEHSVPPVERLLAIGDAPGADNEIAEIEAIWGPDRVDALLGEHASETAVFSRIGGFRIYHFATHAEAHLTNGGRSHLRLRASRSDDGYLHAAEIRTADWSRTLIVLSGCETNLGPTYRGGGIQGLASAFLEGGAQRVIGTQWPIGPATAELMARFYRGLAEGMDSASALRQGRLELRSDPALAHPYYWGAFVIIG